MDNTNCRHLSWVYARTLLLNITLLKTFTNHTSEFAASFWLPSIWESTITMSSRSNDPYWLFPVMASLIYSIKDEMLVTDPGVHWNDIDGLNDTKGLLQETVVLPFPMPDFFRCICRPWKGILMVGRSYRNRKDGSGQSRRHRIQNPVLQSVGVDPHIQTCITVTHRKKLVKVLFEMAKFHALSTIFMWQWFLTRSFASIQI